MEPPPGARVIEARATRAWLGADGLVRFSIRPSTDFVVEDSAAALEALAALAPSLPASVLADCRGVRTADRPSRVFWKRPEARRAVAAMALLVGSPATRMIASFFMRLVHPEFAVGIFSSEDEASRWLLEVGR